MNVVVVYESMFGNTRKVAEAVAEALRAGPGAQVTVVPVTGATPDLVAAADLLVVGAPTHMFGMSRPNSRSAVPETARKAVAAGHAVEVEWPPDARGVREWLATLAPARPGATAAAFDTRMGFQKVGGAAPPMARRLRRLGYRVVARPIGFDVARGEGPMLEGELARAAAWAARLPTVRRPADVATGGVAR